MNLITIIFIALFCTIMGVGVGWLGSIWLLKRNIKKSLDLNNIIKSLDKGNRDYILDGKKIDLKKELEEFLPKKEVIPIEPVKLEEVKPIEEEKKDGS